MDVCHDHQAVTVFSNLSVSANGLVSSLGYARFSQSYFGSLQEERSLYLSSSFVDSFIIVDELQYWRTGGYSSVSRTVLIDLIRSYQAHFLPSLTVLGIPSPFDKQGGNYLSCVIAITAP